MAYSEALAQRVRDTLVEHGQYVTEKKMFGGIAFMYRGNMCCGIVKDDLMVRVGPEQHATTLALPHAHEMDFTGRPMKGMIYVKPEGVSNDADLATWINRGLDFVKTLPAK